MKALISLLLLLPSFAFADVSVPRAKQYLWTQYNVATFGGQSTSHALNAALPAGAIITDVYVYINTPFAAVGPNESLAFQCAGTRDLMDYQGMSNATMLQDRMLYAHVGSATANDGSALIPLNGSATNLLNVSQGFGSVPTDCQVTAVVRNSSGYSDYSSGNASLVIEYFKK